MPKIFISYRRADSRKDAGRLYDRLVDAFGKDHIFKDIDNIPLGSDFRGVLREAVAQCDVLLAVIGQQWLTVNDEHGNRRLDNAGDFVRLEIESGLQRDHCVVIPLLVDNAPMPQAKDLPDVLRELAFKNALSIRDDPDFHPDVSKLIRSLEQQFGTTPTTPSTAPTKPPVTPIFDVNAAISRFYEQFENKAWDAAKATLSEIRASGKAPRVFNIDAHDREVWAAMEVEERDQEYQVLQLMAKRSNPRQVWDALVIFWKSYPDYDPDNLYRFKPAPPVSPKPILPKVAHLLPAPFDWCPITAGQVTLEDNKGTFDVVPFDMAKYPVTNAQFQVFVDAQDGYSNPQWWAYSEASATWHKDNVRAQDKIPISDNCPRTDVCWYEAIAFCRWLSSRTNEKITLPTEWQWQRSAEGDQKLIFPWGKDWDGTRCNHSVKHQNTVGITPVTKYEGKGDSSFKVVDLGGNIWELCLNGYKSTETNIRLINYHKIISSRGGAWNSRETVFFRTSTRAANSPISQCNWLGFRIARLNVAGG